MNLQKNEPYPHISQTDPTNKGQAALEALVGLVALSLLAAPLVNLSQWYLVRMRAHLAARHGAFLSGSERMDDRVVAEEVKRFLDEGTPRVRREAVTVDIGAPASSWAAAMRLVEVKVSVRMRWLGYRAWLEKSEAGEVSVKESCVVVKAPRYGF